MFSFRSTSAISSDVSGLKSLHVSVNKIAARRIHSTPVSDCDAILPKAIAVTRNVAIDAHTKKIGDASQQILMIKGGAGNGKRLFGIFGNKSKDAERAADKNENKNRGSTDSPANYGVYPAHFGVYAVLFLFAIWQVVTIWFVSIHLLTQFVTRGVLAMPELGDVFGFTFSLVPLLLSFAIAVFFDSLQSLRHTSKFATEDLVCVGSTGGADGRCDVYINVGT